MSRTFPVRLPDGTTRQFVYDSGPDVDLATEDVRLPDGTRLTDALVETIIEESDRGRPSLDGTRGAPSPRLSLRLRPETVDVLDRLAEQDGHTRSEVARGALEDFARRARRRGLA